MKNISKHTNITSTSSKSSGKKTRRVVDVVNGVVGAELPQVLLDPVVHQRLLELNPVSLHQEEQLVLPRD